MKNISFTFVSMSFNTFGKILSLTTFGESHAEAIGGVLDGCPPNLLVDMDYIRYRLSLRSPANVAGGTQRIETDAVEFLSGIYNGKTLGTPIAFIIRNKNTKAEDYTDLTEIYRPSHADYTYQTKYGIRDPRGGGRASARETAVRVVAAAILLHYFDEKEIHFNAFSQQIGSIALKESYQTLDVGLTYQSQVRCPHPPTAELMLNEIEKTALQGDSLGGIVSCAISHLPAGLGEPIYNKLSAQLAAAMFSIPAVKGFEIGSGFNAASMKGSEHNDAFTNDFKTLTNHSGGIQGGISNGMDVVFNVAFKPVSSIKLKQESMNVRNEKVEFSVKGRHDVCIVPRAVPVVESMAQLVIADFLLLNNLQNIDNR
ncbi:MAG: chorismate synthase [Bacteroidota bacterium]